MSFKKIAVIGATGLLGKPVLTALVNSGFKVSALVRNPSKANLPNENTYCQRRHKEGHLVADKEVAENAGSKSISLWTFVSFSVELCDIGFLKLTTLDQE